MLGLVSISLKFSNYASKKIAFLPGKERVKFRVKSNSKFEQLSKKKRKKSINKYGY